MHDTELVEQRRQRLVTAALEQPRILLPCVKTERNVGGEGEGGILANVVIRAGVGAFDGAVLRGIERLQRRRDFARREILDLELTVGGFRDALDESVGGGGEPDQVFGKAGGEPPFDCRL